MTGESRETEPFQKALMMETGTVIFLKCLSEWFSEKKISRVRKPGAPDTALKSYDFPRFLRQRGNEIGWNTEFTVPLHRGGFFIFAVLRKEGCHVPHTYCRTYQEIIW